MNATGSLRPTGSPPLAPRRDPAHERTDAAALAVSVLDARTFVEVTVPRTNVRGRLRLLSRAEERQVRSEARQAMRSLGLDAAATANEPGVYTEFGEELVTRRMAVAVRRLDADEPLAPLAEWEECDDDQINGLWDRYRDLQHELDPIADRTIPEAMLTEIANAAKKKDARLLLSYGSYALATYAITTADRPPI